MKMMKQMMILNAIGSSVQAFHAGSTSARPSTLVLFAKKSTASNTKRCGDFWEANMDGFRPTINDVERISWGKPAKRKGTGSRGIPHRLNEEERLLFDQARRRGFLEVAGSGWRSQRRDAPLLNTYRSLCDARGQASIVLQKDKTGIDDLVIDLSPLRYHESFHEVAVKCLEQLPDGEIVFADSNQNNSPTTSDDDNDVEVKDEESSEVSAWSTRPIYQLPPYCIVWSLPRGEAKAAGKKMASLFDTIEKKAGSSKKPIGVKHGKSRRHGGYGIG